MNSPEYVAENEEACTYTMTFFALQLFKQATYDQQHTAAIDITVQQRQAPMLPAVTGDHSCMNG